ncbi:enoyl-CoA hydratase/isomerase family protein [Myxococcota bacterium]|nr:enoyl-CoA hydratase/isomerase family protein [Myxococcota bacterium]MBU1430336.1 enoyl-CoA hydratase/isomerase family protein [Myxococcota bacterium]MBU1896391.1 enoyl-CoA hydratase/isomerase family protein [Myxococcota bacterium]
MSVCVYWRGEIARLIVDRPQARNSLAPETMDALERAVEGLGAARALILSGGGGRFIAGGDLRALDALRGAAAGEAMSAQMQRVLGMIEALPCPTIAAVQRYAYGGGVEVALAADLIIADMDAVFGFRHLDYALSTAWGGGRRLVRRVGRARALMLQGGAMTLSAEEAARWGLIDERAEDALEAAWAWAARFAAQPPEALQAITALSRAAEALPAEAYEAEERARFAPLWAADTHWARVEAFWAARTPRR